MEPEGHHVWSRMDVGPPDFGPQEGRGPVHAGSASHSAHRMRRSSLPTLIKTKAASSLPVFEPANTAGLPYAFLTVALLAIATSLLLGLDEDGLAQRDDRRSDEPDEKHRQSCRRHQPLTEVEF